MQGAGRIAGIGCEEREFLKTLAVGGLAASLHPAHRSWPDHFPGEQFEKLVPADKKLDPAWVQSLFARGRGASIAGRVGEDRHARGRDLRRPGLPWRRRKTLAFGISSTRHIGTGEAITPSRRKPASPLEQGFAVRVTADGKDTPEQSARSIGSGFAEVTFRGEYPIGLVEYPRSGLPVAVSLEAFSPFIPLDAENRACRQPCCVSP